MGLAGSLREVKRVRRYLFLNSEVGQGPTTGIGNYGERFLLSAWHFETYFLGFRLHLGGQIPKTIDVYSPRLNTKVTIDIPESGGNQTLYSIFTRENLIQLCLESLRKLPDYKYLIEKALESGKSPQVNWRYQANLDWVWLDHDVFGKPRKWAVLCGVAFKQVSIFFISYSVNNVCYPIDHETTDSRDSARRTWVQFRTSER